MKNDEGSVSEMTAIHSKSVNLIQIDNDKDSNACSSFENKILQ